MSWRFLISGEMPWIILLILPLSSFCQVSNESKISKALNWCSQKHCEDCSGNEVVCTNSAISNRYGDLCGCCHTCVQIRDLGASCGSQLAVRTSFTNFEDSRSRVTVFATTRCKAGLVCTNFICESSDDRIDRISPAPVERNVDDIQEKNDVNNSEESKIFYNPDRSYDASGPSIHLNSNIKMHHSTEKNEVLSIQTEVKQSNEEFLKNIRDLEKHFVNVIIDDKEFQLIYGKTALIDLEMLLNSFNKTESTLIPNEIEARFIYERFQNVIQQLNRRKSSIFKKVTNETKMNNNLPDSNDLVFLHQLFLPRSLKLNRLRPTIRIRRKRELENTKEENPRSEYSEIYVYDFLNKTPKLMQNSSRHWLIARQVDKDLGEKLLSSKSSNMEPAINIHISGIPKSVKSSGDFDLLDESETRERRTVTGTKDYANYDDELEIFVTDASTELPEFSQTDEDHQNSSNFTISQISQEFPDIENENYKINNISEKYWDTSIIGEKNSQYSDNNYQFIFPENPVILENEDYHDLSIRINETVDEFKSQLDRIETKVVGIESSLYDMIMKIEAKERSKNGENKRRVKNLNFYQNLRNLPVSRRTVINNPKIIKPEESNQFIGRYVLFPKPKANYNSNENSTPTYQNFLPINKNGRNFNIEDEGIAQLIPIRSNRQWRTVTLQPTSESQNILRRGRHDRNKVNDESQRRRRKTTQRYLSSEQRDTISSNTRRASKEDPIYSIEQTQSPIFLSNSDTRSYTVTKAPNHFSRERQSLKFTADPSRANRQVIWPLNPAWDRQLSADRNKRKIEEANRRSGSNLETEATPSIESISILETQIPKSVIRTRMSKDFDKRMMGSSSRLEPAMIPMVASMRHSFNDENDWHRNSWDEVPSLNLFVVNGESKSEFVDEAHSNSPESYENPVLSMENENSKSENNWDIIYPAYLDYSENLRRDEEQKNEETPIVEAEAESSINLQRSRQIGKETVERKKRNVLDNFHDEKIDRTISTKWKNVSTNRDDKNKKKRSKIVQTPIVEAEAESSINLQRSQQIGKEIIERKKRNVPDNFQGEKTDRTISTKWKNVSTNGDDEKKKKISKRSVQMVDWLRAAQEYHERLHQVRNAALRTWLASREELADGNLTNVKLFTREIPSYLQKYTPSFTSEDNSALKSEASHEDPQISTFINDESFAEFFPNQSSIMDNENKLKNSSNEMNSVVARKFTIVTTGNSSIRIEELPEISEDVNDSLLMDQSSEASSHQMALTSGDSDDFDHMYESVDAEDEDFDYGDPNLAMSRWLDEVDIIDASSVETPEDKRKSIDDNNEDSSNIEEDYEVDELLSRTKRNTPLLLFKVKGNPSQDVVVWPSNWKDFINRHFQRNRTRNSPISSTRNPKRTRRISKIGSAKTPNFDTKVQTLVNRGTEMFSSEGNPEEYEKKSIRQFDYARRHNFDDEPRLGKRKNNQRNI